MSTPPNAASDQPADGSVPQSAGQPPAPQTQQPPAPQHWQGQQQPQPWPAGPQQPAYAAHPQQPAPSGQPQGGQSYGDHSGAPTPQQQWAAAHPPQGSPADPGAKRGNPAGLFAAILVGVTMVIAILQTVVTATLITGTAPGYSLYGTVTMIIAVVQGLIALAAVVLGAIGLAQRGRPKALAGIGLGGGAVVLVQLLASQLLNLMLIGFNG